MHWGSYPSRSDPVASRHRSLETTLVQGTRNEGGGATAFHPYAGTFGTGRAARGGIDNCTAGIPRRGGIEARRCVSGIHGAPCPSAASSASTTCPSATASYATTSYATTSHATARAAS